MKRVFNAVFVVLILVLVTTMVSAEDVVLKFWHTYNMETEEGQTMNEVIIPAFEKEHPGVKVESLAFPYDEFRKKLMVSIAGGKAPDVVRSDIIWVPELANQGVLTNFSKEFGEEFNSYLDKVFPGPLSTNLFNGDYYGIPLDTNTRVMIWNKKLFDETGLDSPPETFAELKEVAAKLTKDTNNDGEIDQWGVAVNGSWPWHVLPWIWSNGGAVTNEEMTQASGYLNSPESIEAIEYLVDLYQEGYMAETIVGGGEDTGAGYGNDHYGIIFGGPWFYSIIKGQFPEKEIDFALWPRGSNGASISVVGGENVIIPQGSKNKELAWEFTKFLLKEENQIKMAEVGQIPVVKSVVESEYFKDHPFYGTFMEQLETAKARTVHPQWNQIKNELHTAFEAAFLGKMDVKEALDTAAARIDNILK